MKINRDHILAIIGGVVFTILIILEIRFARELIEILEPNAELIRSHGGEVDFDLKLKPLVGMLILTQILTYIVAFLIPNKPKKD